MYKSIHTIGRHFVFLRHIREFSYKQNTLYQTCIKNTGFNSFTSKLSLCRVGLLSLSNDTHTSTLVGGGGGTIESNELATYSKNISYTY